MKRIDKSRSERTHPREEIPRARFLRTAPVRWLVTEMACRQANKRQVVRAPRSSDYRPLVLPPPQDPIMPGVVWGRCDTLFTPAYWRTQAWYRQLDNTEPDKYSLGNTLAEETAACLLGGYGIPAEVALAAFERVRDRGLLEGAPPDVNTCHAVLTEPLSVAGRKIRYRFARQKSVYLSAALMALSQDQPPTDSHTAFRDWLLELPGIGLKTASWITRNWLSSNVVAIIDVHVYRAGIIAGFFMHRHKLPADYNEMERRFIRFAHLIGVRPGFLDALIWRDMRRAGAIARDLAAAPTTPAAKP